MEKNNTHLAGEYFVAAELYRKGFSVGMTIGNAKAIDLFVNKDNKIIPLQVKAIKDKKSVGWPIMKKSVRDKIFYIFVNLNGDNLPEYYILKGSEARKKVKQYRTRGIINLNSLKHDNYMGRWDKLDKK